VVRVRAAGVNPVDTYIRSGTYAIKPALPYTPGMDAAGVIAEVGSDVKGMRAGDRMYTAGTLSGAYAEFALCAASQVHPLPERVSFAQGAGVFIPYGTVEIDPRATMGRDASILGMVLAKTPEPEMASIHAALAAGLENGTLRPVVGREMPLADAPRAHQAVMEPGAYGKIVLVP